MTKKKAKNEDFSKIEIDMEKVVRLGSCGLTREKMEEAKKKSFSVDAKRAAKVLKSVRYDEDLLAEIQKLAGEERIPYQTLMNSLLKTGLKIRREASGTDIIERLERIEKRLFARKKTG